MEHNFGHYSLQNEETLLLSDKEGWYYTRLADIVYCASDNSYTEFFLTSGQRVIVSRPLKYYEQLTAAYGFFRIHQSHLINTRHLANIARYDEVWNVQMSNKHLLPISRDRKSILIKKLEALSLAEAPAYYAKPLPAADKKRAGENILMLSRIRNNTENKAAVLSINAS